MIASIRPLTKKQTNYHKYGRIGLFSLYTDYRYTALKRRSFYASGPVAFCLRVSFHKYLHRTALSSTDFELGESISFNESAIFTAIVLRSMATNYFKNMTTTSANAKLSRNVSTGPVARFGPAVWICIAMALIMLWDIQWDHSIAIGSAPARHGLAQMQESGTDPSYWYLGLGVITSGPAFALFRTHRFNWSDKIALFIGLACATLWLKNALFLLAA